MARRVRDTGWFTSSYSGGGNENCVEVRVRDAAVGVRDSKNATGPAFAVRPATWAAFVAVAARFGGRA